jgi:hypothetical protein
MIGVAYIHAVTTTLQINWVSRKNTMVLERIKETPMENKIIHSMPNGKSRIVHLMLTPVKITTISKGITAKTKLIVEEKTLAMGKIYFGTYTFVIKEALPTIEVIAIVVASEKKL